MDKQIATIADAVTEIVEMWSPQALPAFFLWVDHNGGDWESAANTFEDSYRGTYPGDDEDDALRTYAMEFFSEVYIIEVPGGFTIEPDMPSWRADTTVLSYPDSYEFHIFWG